MIFRFKLNPTRNSPPSLRGQQFRPRPYVPIGLKQLDGTFDYTDYLLDTGSDDIILPLKCARELKIRFHKSEVFIHSLADMSRMSVGYGDVEFRLAISPFHYVQWRTSVGFAPVERPVFGWAGGLEFFHVSFDWMLARVALIPLASLPLTASAFPRPDRSRETPM